MVQVATTGASELEYERNTLGRSAPLVTGAALRVFFGSGEASASSCFSKRVLPSRIRTLARIKNSPQPDESRRKLVERSAMVTSGWMNVGWRR